MNLTKKLITLFFVLASFCQVMAQNQYRVNMHYQNGYDCQWSFPFKVEHMSHFNFSDDLKELRGHRIDEEEGYEMYIPFNVDYIDSITFSDEIPDSLEGHDKHKVFALYITTDGGLGVKSKDDYVDCYISLDGKGEYGDYSGPARIKGRGNSTWLWYDKKPYRIKLAEKHKMLGLDKNKDWVLLANFRDPTDLMNAFVFEVADWMGMDYVNHTRFVEVWLDGDYIGLYQLTEQIEQGKSRVDVADEGGILLTMDLDDGPSLSPEATDNFWSDVFSLPMAVKYPEDVTEDRLEEIKADFAQVEEAIKAANYQLLDSLMDMRSFMTMTMLQEYTMNVEICAPRSIYLYKDAGGKWFMGPFWDWDAGFCFDWTDYERNHTFFGEYTSLMLGADPANRRGGRSDCPKYFTNMFKSDTYTKEYKALWNSVKDSLLTRNWAEMEKYVDELEKGAYYRDSKRWPIVWNGHTFIIDEEINKLHTWLINRTYYLNEIINNYPETGQEGDDSNYGVVSTVVDKSQNTITINAIMNAADGYGQDFRIEINQTVLAEMFRVPVENMWAMDLVALNSDGSVGQNTAAGVYGAWFDANGNTNQWGSGHVYIESNELYSWACGSHPDNCYSGHTHTVYMKYSMNVNGKTKSVVVKINFGINTAPVDNGKVIPGEGGEGSGEEDAKTIEKSYTLAKSGGYAQNVKVEVDKEELAQLLGVSSSDLSRRNLSLVPLNVDGTEGNNTAAKTYGAWFDENGDTNEWRNGHVYIESDDLYSWACGCHPDNCTAGDIHTVTMQYIYTNGSVKKTVNVVVTFFIS